MKKLLKIALAVTGLVLLASNNVRAQEAGQTETNRLIATGRFASPVIFEWHPGSLGAFLEAIKSTYKVDLKTIADIPQQMLNYTRVPAMKLKASSFVTVLSLYNEIAEAYPQLGHWFYRLAEDKEPTAILLIAPKQTEENTGSKIRAFSLHGWAEGPQVVGGPTVREQLERLINNEADRLRASSETIDPALISGEFRIYPAEKILVAKGGKTYVEMVETLVGAFRESFGPKH